MELFVVVCVAHSAPLHQALHATQVSRVLKLKHPTGRGHDVVGLLNHDQEDRSNPSGYLSLEPSALQNILLTRLCDGSGLSENMQDICIVRIDRRLSQPSKLPKMLPIIRRIDWRWGPNIATIHGVQAGHWAKTKE
ncbi:uncharacterized protein BO97DRAFT_11170 [Aspergillus homomorphus CBS 101889]|uniref:Uncharacterized protein n=1 Tax=Aspergillus homomorphus (strain CBS 101889) TaxID=1450537 RepID=A0A395IBP9_ASPHC|nr:hypothetical protein BO97DRAFT_11170 [Aspergillus homomorphus CBS 101889]RAL17627.1 hypothetical protein BO97DRAFT_11170 [Aspergillus homomorphus CBS 101889]